MNAALRESCHPILSCEEAVKWESTLLDAGSEWTAMNAVGHSLAAAIRSDYGMSRRRQTELRLLGLIGKGHNGGDALLALRELVLCKGLVERVTLILSCPFEEMKPNAKRAYDLLDRILQLNTIAPKAAEDPRWLREVERKLSGESFDICIDGLLGMQFRPPLRGASAKILERANASERVGFRVAVDLPSGVGDESDPGAFRADATYATGIFKKPLLENPAVGMCRYLDIGFFKRHDVGDVNVLTDRILDDLRSLRPARSEKRQFGHLAILAGSRQMPGALNMCVQAALRSGVGLVTVFAPESVVSHHSGLLPEAMWRPWPETPEGGLALEGLWQIRSIADKASALLAGPGLGRGRETQALLIDLAREWDKPVALDADALQPEVIEAFRQAGNRSVVVTPHDGEFKRLSRGDDVSDAAALRYAKENGLCLVKKGSATRVSDGERIWVNATGNAVLARGGSGDLLAGLIGGLLARGGDAPEFAACRAVYWHGKAADLLASAKGQTATRTTDLLDFLSPALQFGEVWNQNSRGPKRTGF